jgi:hypothetical protein
MKTLYSDASSDNHVPAVIVVLERWQCSSQKPHVSFDINGKAFILPIKSIVSRHIPKPPLGNRDSQKDKTESTLQ